MKDTKIKKILKILLKILGSIFAIISIILISILCYLHFDEKAHCLDIGKIYDPIQKICRDDCLTWDKKSGCVPITEENKKKRDYFNLW